MGMVEGGAAGDYSTSIGDGSSDNSSSSDSSSRKKSGGMSKKTKDRLSSAGNSLSDMGSDEADRSAQITASIRPVQYKRGGRVRKTGPAIVHKDERVIPASKRKKAEKVMRKAGMSLTNKKRGKKRKAGRSGGRS